MPWLLGQRVSLPDELPGFIPRAALAQRLDPLRRRLTVLHAPGGFGKSTALADCVRRARADGILAAWLTVDEDEEAATFDSYLSYAFSAAGLAIVGDEAGSAHDAVVRRIEAHGAPCLLAIDDVDRLHDAGSLEAVSRLLRNAPPNLHLALALRTLPASLDIAAPLLDGRGTIVGPEDLRFSRPETARYFDARLTRRELATLMRQSGGWPIALCIHRNAAAEAVGDVGTSQLAANWIEARLLRGLADADRELLLDAGLFEWFDSALLDGVLGAGSMRRLLAMRELSGLVQRVGGEREMRLHPLVAAYCDERRLRDTPTRYRAVHGALATVLAERAQFVAAMQHAAQAGESELVGRILEDAGGVRLWLRQGIGRFRAADALLTADVRQRFPRLALLHCMALTMDGRLEEAKRAYAEVGVRTDNFTRDRDGGNDWELNTENTLFQALHAFCGCQPIDAPTTVETVAALNRLANQNAVDRLARGTFRHCMSIVESQHANFELARDWAEGSRHDLARGSRYLTMYADVQMGIRAMAKGETAEAAACYARARSTARENFLQDPGLVAIVDVLAGELQTEQGGAPTAAGPPAPPLRRLAESGAWLDVYAAAVGTAAETADRAADADSSAILEAGAEFARRTERPTLLRVLSALRVSALVGAGRIDAAARVARSLPQRDEDCLDLAVLSWREMEAVSCARLRLLTARGDFATAQRFADAFVGLAVERGLGRTEMRALALSAALAVRAGNPVAATRGLGEYARRYATVDYAAPVIREADALRGPLERLADADLDPASSAAVAALLAALDGDGSGAVPQFTERESEILQRLGHSRDKEIAAALDLSEDGVRYHLRKIFAKLGVGNRADAVRRAQALGALGEGTHSRP